MAESKSNTSGSILSTAVFAVFLFLKLAGIGEVANWSWWWVTSPLWLPAIVALVVSILGDK